MDINNDGHIDIISGSWPGEIFLFKGGPDHTFAAPEMIKDKDGNIIIDSKAKSWVAEHLNYQINNAAELYTPEVFNDDVLKKIDSLILPIFNYSVDDDQLDDVIDEKNIDEVDSIFNENTLDNQEVNESVEND